MVKIYVQTPLKFWFHIKFSREYDYVNEYPYSAKLQNMTCWTESSTQSSHIKGLDKCVWCWVCSVLSKQRGEVVWWGGGVRFTKANCGQESQWPYTDCGPAVTGMFTSWIPQGALAAKRPAWAKMAAIRKRVVPRFERAKRRLQWARTCSMSWRQRWRAWWNSSSNRAGENAVAPQARPQARVNRIHHRRPILTQTPTTNPAITAKAGSRSRKRRCNRSEGCSPRCRHEDPSARGHEAARPGCKQDGAGSDSDDPFSGLHNAIQSANHSNNKSDYTHGFQDTIRDMESFFETGDKMGDPINDAFASIFSSSLRRRPNNKALLDTADKYPRPVNIPNLAVPKTNDVIWKRMGKGPQIVDAHLQKVQTCVSKTLVPMISIMNEIWEGGSNRPASDHAQKITDALRLGCVAFSLLSQVRKEVIRNDLNHTFAKLCTWKYEVGTDQLFIADVIKQLKEL